MEQVYNIYNGPIEVRRLLTGRHEVADIFCVECHSLVGWKYISAAEESQKYKEKHFILEKSKFTQTHETI
jgi:hypothetical protein